MNRGPELQIAPLDAAEVAEVAALAARSFERGASEEELRGELARDVSTVLVARAGGRAVGYAVLWTVAGEAELHAIAVDEAARGRGVGGRLLDAILAAAPPVVHLEVRASNAPALALYRRAGFEVVHVRPRYYADGEDALLMTRRAR